MITDGKPNKGEEEPDIVEEAGEESFPASDPPAFATDGPPEKGEDSAKA